MQEAEEVESEDRQRHRAATGDAASPDEHCGGGGGGGGKGRLKDGTDSEVARERKGGEGEIEKERIKTLAREHTRGCIYTI